MTIALETDAVLARYRQRAADEIERRLPRGEPSQWLYGPMADYPRRTGKGLRAALCLAACRAFGGTEDDALAVAAAIELAHCAFLVHDDISDASLTRRGRPTLHRSEGLPLALNAGDGLAVLSLAVLRDGCRAFGPRLGARVFDEFLSAMWQTIEGQALELGWRRDGVVDVSARDYLAMVLGKTCWYTTIAPVRIGALIGSRGTADLDMLSRFGLFLGTAFQITDDVLNLTGGHAVYGKEIHGDLREGKRTLMLIHLLAVATPDHRRAVVNFLVSPEQERTNRQVRFLADLLGRYGSVDFAREFACGVADAAAAAFPDAFRAAAEPEHAEMIRHLVRYAVQRTH
jgi:geranylgeranyl diphosphate synthase, type II